MFGKWRRKRREKRIEFDEIFLDASNLPSFDNRRLEGKIELPIRDRSLRIVAGFFGIVVLLFTLQLFQLQLVEGSSHRTHSDQNRLNESLIIAERGVIYDRNGERLAWNEEGSEDDVPARAYSDRDGLGQVIGFVSYPQKDRSGFFYRTEYLGRTGVEASYHKVLAGENGRQLIETDALGSVVSGGVVEKPVPGEALDLSLDAEFSEAIYHIIEETTRERGFRSGTGAVMDVETGELLALTSFPSFDPEVMADGDDVGAIAALNRDERFPFLNKISDGLYTPGSIVKPFLAYAALAEELIVPEREMVSTGRVSVPNPYNPSRPSIFTDWKAHGSVDMRRAIAISSNIYFYAIGGGFEPAVAAQAQIDVQEGLGIARINEYVRAFGLGSETGFALGNEKIGTVPNPSWKEELFGDDWRLGDTYLTAIGQYGFQVTPLQMLRAYAALANGGYLVTPHLEKGHVSSRENLALDSEALRVVQEGLRASVEEGTAASLSRSDVAIAGKTGTAELDSGKQFINSWVIGYFPYEQPRYAFVLMLERGPYKNLFGAAPTMRGVFDWMAEHRPGYVGI